MTLWLKFRVGKVYEYEIVSCDKCRQCIHYDRTKPFHNIAWAKVGTRSDHCIDEIICNKCYENRSKDDEEE